MNYLGIVLTFVSFCHEVEGEVRHILMQATTALSLDIIIKIQLHIKTATTIFFYISFGSIIHEMFYMKITYVT